MALTSEQVYNSLNGAEVREIFEIRFSELLSQIQLLQPHITLPRVRMRIRVDAEMPASQGFSIDHTLTVRAENEDMAMAEDMAEAMAMAEDTDTAIGLSMSIDAGTTPVDQIRVEHGLPITELKRTPLGIREEKVVVEGQTHNKFVIDRGGPVTRGFDAPTAVVKQRSISPVNPSPVKADFANNVLKKSKDKL